MRNVAINGASIVNGVACQQQSLTVGVILLNRLSSACGLVFTDRNGARYAFPMPEDLAGAAPETVRSLGFSGAKTRTLIDLGREISERKLVWNRWRISRMTRRRPGWWNCAAWGAGPPNTPCSEEWAGSTFSPATTSAPATILSGGCTCESLSTMIALHMSSADGSHMEDLFTSTCYWTA
jgi:hypothetical protein